MARRRSDKTGCEPDDHVYKERGANNWRECPVHTRTYSNSSRFDCFFLSKRHLKEYALVVFGPLWTTSPETTSDGDQAAASTSSTRTAVVLESASASSRGRGSPSDRWRAERSVPLREWRMPGHKFPMVLVTHVVPGLLRVRGAENWLRLAKIPAGAHGPLVRLGRQRRDL